MSNKYLKAKNGINLQPQTVAPSGLEDGDVYHDATQGLMVRTNGVVAPAGGSNSGAPAGSIMMYAGSTEPSGWVFCYGQAISRVTFSDLFTAIGTTFGPGDGSTTFNLPDLRGRVPAGRDDMGGVAANRLTAGVSGITGTTLGASGGNQNMHQHNHASTGLSVSGTFATSSHTHNHEHVHPVMNSNSAVGRLNGWDFANAWAYGTGGGIATALEALGTQSGSGVFRNYPISGSNYFYSRLPLDSAGNSNPNTGGPSASSSPSLSGSVANTGTGASQNVQPTIILNYIIKT